MAASVVIKVGEVADIQSEVGDDGEGVVEVGDVYVVRASELHIDSVGRLIKDNLRDKVDPIDQLTTEDHELIVAILMPHLQIHIVVL